MFLKLTGIEGDATDKKFAKQIDLHDLMWGVSHSSNGTPGVRTSQLSGQASFQPFVLTKHPDGSSPKLALACAKGEDIETAEISICGPDANRKVVIKYTLSQVQVKSLDTEVGEDGNLEEKVTLRYAKIKGEYLTLDGKNTSAFDFDIAGNN